MVIAVAIVVIVAAIWIRASVGRAIAQPRPDQGLALLQNQVNALNAQMAQALDQTRKSLDQRLDNAAQVIQGVSKQLGQLDESSRRIFEIGKDMAGLQEVLRSPKLRGNLYYSAANYDNDTVLSGTAVTSDVHAFSANLIYSPLPKLDVGAELRFANRELESGADGDLRRLHFIVRYNF